MLTAETALDVLSRLHSAGCHVWLAGGWGVDALLGRQTRDHTDLDLLHRADEEADVLAALSDFTEAENLRPVRFVLTRPDSASLDLHPLHFAADGSATQAADDTGGTFRYPADCFATGTVEGVTVPCLSVAQQLLFHQGYEPRAHDLADVAALHAAFGRSAHQPR
ncbi:nucleotidyltransferase domain-containing protein [Amycolatopsis sp. NPDC051903]|uniref:nucleotidyltransferase domain-containing protein n=1 Tax=Amycolatopsis sp. NPDC051903 TaxID=3363936 RepID=UPI00379B4F6E